MRCRGCLVWIDELIVTGLYMVSDCAFFLVFPSLSVKCQHLASLSDGSPFVQPKCNGSPHRLKISRRKNVVVSIRAPHVFPTTSTGSSSCWLCSCNLVWCWQLIQLAIHGSWYLGGHLRTTSSIAIFDSLFFLRVRPAYSNHLTKTWLLCLFFAWVCQSNSFLLPLWLFSLAHLVLPFILPVTHMHSYV